MSIEIKISVGELLDKITILQIKLARITAPDKLRNIRTELRALSKIWQASAYARVDLEAEIAVLKEVNERLWEIEDAIRDKERDSRFDSEFIELARSVYLNNDQRAGIKRAINAKTGSELVEEKSYADYGA